MELIYRENTKKDIPAVNPDKNKGLKLFIYYQLKHLEKL